MFYGWFERTARGVYALTEAGQAALRKWPGSDVEHAHAGPPRNDSSELRTKESLG